MIRILADDKIPFLEGVLEPIAEIRYVPGHKINREMAQHADALIIRTRTKCTDELLKDTPVQFIATATIGFDHIDTHYCEKNNIHWTNAKGCNSSSVQQYIAATLLKIASQFRFDLKDKTLGIIGVGNVVADYFSDLSCHLHSNKFSSLFERKTACHEHCDLRIE
jgi:erythronate-4-phosphate dehydrogenase